MSVDVATADLAVIPVGSLGTVVGFNPGDHDKQCRRLRDLGFLPGTPVEVVRRAPFGGPTVFEIRGYQVALRSADCARIMVEPGCAVAAQW